MKPVLNRVYNGLASLKLTIVTLAVLAVALIVGTFYESSNGTPMAHKIVYSSKWFDAILITLTINMVACTAKRYPYKPHQLGFLMVHCGILSILTGAMLTRNFGRDGELYLNEGETRDYMTSTRPFLKVSVPKEGLERREVPIVFPAKSAGAEVDKTLDVPGSSVRLHCTRYFPNARQQEEIVAGEAPNPAVQVRLSHADQVHEEWLLPRQAGRDTLSMTPVRVVAQDVSSPAEAESRLAAVEAERPHGRGVLRLQSADRALATIPLDGPVPRTVHSGEFEVRLREWYSNFAFDQGRPVNASAAMVNPAVLFDVAGPRGTENHIAFAFHEFRSLVSPESDHGYDIKAKYAYEGIGQSHPIVQLLHVADGSWRIGANFDLDVAADRKVEMGRAYTSAAAGGVEIQVLQAIERGVPRQKVVNVDRQELNPALELQVLHGNDRTEPEWMFYGDHRTFDVGGTQVALEFDRKQMPLGFAVHLVDFREKTYPGTTRSASFESDVVISDSRGVPVPINISMNQPLKYRGFRLFQASYARSGGTEASIFSVSYDPGVHVVYTGFIIFIVGLVVIFYLKPVIRKAYAAPRPAAGAPSRKDPS